MKTTITTGLLALFAVACAKEQPTDPTRRDPAQPAVQTNAQVALVLDKVP